MPQPTSRQGVACDADPKGRGGFAAAAGLTRLRGSSGSCLKRPRGIATATVITGGFSEQELHEAGAAAVFDSLLELRRHLDEPPFV